MAVLHHAGDPARFITDALVDFIDPATYNMSADKLTDGEAVFIKQVPQPVQVLVGGLLIVADDGSRELSDVIYSALVRAVEHKLQIISMRFPATRAASQLFWPLRCYQADIVVSVAKRFIEKQPDHLYAIKLIDDDHYCFPRPKPANS